MHPRAVPGRFGYTTSGSDPGTLARVQDTLIPLKNDIPVRRAPAMTWVLLLVNRLAFACRLDRVLVNGGVADAGLPLGEAVQRLTGGSTSRAHRGRDPLGDRSCRDIGPRDIVIPPLTLLTSMFLHGGFLHIAGNMLFLWIFGNNVEDALGRVRYLFFYLASGLVAASSQVLVAAFSADKESLLVPMVGASGAIAGVLAGYVLLFPKARVLTLFVIVIFIKLVYLPASFFIGLWFVIQIVSAFLSGSSGGVAFAAHIGGFVAGFIMMKLMIPRENRPRRFADW